MDKIHFIQRYENNLFVLKDIELLRLKNPLSKVLDSFVHIQSYIDMKNTPKYIIEKLKDFDGKVLSELYDLVSQSEILEYRKGSVLSQNHLVENSKKETRQKRTPQLEYPRINWNNTEDENIQLCIILYSDRTQTWHRMVKLHDILDENPDRAGEMVELDIRNHLAWKELNCFEKNRNFLWEHPVLQKKKRISELIELKKNNPSELLDLFVQNDKGITRYKSQIRTEKYKDDAELVKWQTHIEKFEIENNLICDIINN